MKALSLFKDNKVMSFGNKSLEDNLILAEKVIHDMNDAFRINNHSNTQFAWTRFVLIHEGGLRNARQITAEINKKSLALHEAKHRHARQLVELEIMELEVNKGRHIDRKLIQCDIDEINDNLAISIPPIEGAIKDILSLKAQYDQIMEEFKGYTEDDLERGEVDYWIRRLISQALRDIRERGTVTAGNQGAIENIGLNMSFVTIVMNGYLEKEAESSDPSGKVLEDFLNECVDTLHDTVANFSGYGGFTGERPIHLPTNTDTS